MNDKPDFRKLYHPASFNAWQYIALVGIVMSLGAQLILSLISHPQPAGFHWLYVCWAGLFVVGTLSNFFSKPPTGHHHH
ncbi:hypothetical protein FY528_14325 [Hymenobacter lutimineralis]|uniref:Uncharacterized protein n=1 Tax=Hymenobacter lutimineralis TaxID=2606448 RepID=A0A5D6UZE4_9BACT|nr:MULTISPECIES: hypothetical protein [Hymenobacter]QIX63158.1 hypothetical protein HER32_19075 [Hymenobacter sp. BT18]TYZ07869.1 hypothetical protein FY528_14325 [Hymenobacter lutimineralis]